MSRLISLTLRSAINLLTVRFVLKEIALGLLVFVLSVLWLRVPDASVLDVVGSVLLGLVVVAVAGGGESLLILRLCGAVVTPKKLVLGALFILLGVGLWFASVAVLDHLSGDDSLRAGYLNSRFPHALRNIFSYRHILRWFGWMWAALEWICAGVIAVWAFTMTTSRHPRRSLLTAARSITYWVTLFAGVAIGTTLTGLLVGWVPGKSLGVELLSLILRLFSVMVIDATIGSLLLTILCAIVRASEATHTTPKGTPVFSQPRTTELP